MHRFVFRSLKYFISTNYKEIHGQRALIRFESDKVILFNTYIYIHVHIDIRISLELLYLF